MSGRGRRHARDCAGDDREAAEAPGLLHPPARSGGARRAVPAGDRADRPRRARGFDSAWVAQHHFHEDEGGLPAPFVFLAQVAARTSRIRLGTGIVTPAAGAADPGGRGCRGARPDVRRPPGGRRRARRQLSAYTSVRPGQRRARRRCSSRTSACCATPGRGGRCPAATGCIRRTRPGERVWQATFTVDGARRAGAAGDGLMLSRTQPRPAERPDLSLAEIQNPMIDAYLAALPEGRRAAHPRLAHGVRRRRPRRGPAPRRDRAGRHAGAPRRDRPRGLSRASRWTTMIAAMDTHLGTPDEVIASLQADSALGPGDGLAVQVHSIDPPHPFILRSIELVAEVVAPALGWGASDGAPPARRVTHRAKRTLRMAGTDADVIDTLVGITPGSPWTRSAPGGRAREHAQASYRALFAPELPAASPRRSVSRWAPSSPVCTATRRSRLLRRAASPPAGHRRNCARRSTPRSRRPGRTAPTAAIPPVR